MTKNTGRAGDGAGVWLPKGRLEGWAFGAVDGSCILTQVVVTHIYMAKKAQVGFPIC